MFGLGGGLTNDNVSYYFFSFLPMLIIAAVASTPLAAKLWKRLPEKPRLALLPILLLAGWSSPPPTWWTPPTTPSSTSDSDSGGKP